MGTKSKCLITIVLQQLVCLFVYKNDAYIYYVFSWVGRVQRFSIWEIVVARAIPFWFLLSPSLAYPSRLCRILNRLQN